MTEFFDDELRHEKTDFIQDYDNSPRRHSISSIIINEHFRENYYLNNDIAMLKMTKPMIFSDVQRAICKPTKDSNFYTGKHAIGSGWGTLNTFGKCMFTNLINIYNC